jgi:predicted RNase H-like HicB family nuclease
MVYRGEDGQWVAECLSLPGCVRRIREAIQLYISALEEDHLPVAEERFDTLLVAV